MADITTETTYVAKFTDREYGLLGRALAALAGVDIGKISIEDRRDAALLNTRLLDVQHAKLTEALSIVTGKRDKAEKNAAPYVPTSAERDTARPVVETTSGRGPGPR